MPGGNQDERDTMGNENNKDRLRELVECAESHFGEKVLHTSAPGGEGRASWRFQMESGFIIATSRPNFRRTHLEAVALTKIAEHCDDTPKCLGVVGEIMFQSDVGGRRLNQEIVKFGYRQRADVAHEAIASIFRVQSAGRESGLNKSMPHLGANQEWISNLVEATSVLKSFSAGRSLSVDQDALCERIISPAVEFVKWDCRSGNAAISDDGRLRWFDFEYCGVRHGAEDVAWLIGDEAWPVPPQIMEEIVISAFDRTSHYALDPYLDYLSVYLTLHCVQRLKLILKEANKRGWLSKTRIRKYDDAGVHPEFAAHICKVGAYFAQRDPLTAPIGLDLEDAQKVFEQVLRSGRKVVENMKVPA
ncbi:hypothetical protein LCGC14_0724030 [marine sediment metagenome]|uniref:Aminoglycoside phosphotransferase domain-containing protein n=1 Tax=marine sediment metagenome TaxID=412755 RepID=A0A0F9QBJ0_9ZZZZ